MERGLKLFGVTWATGMLAIECMLSSFGASKAFAAPLPAPVSAITLQPVAIELQAFSTNAATGRFSNIVIHHSLQQWTLQSFQGDTRLGIALGSGADVNGDGYNDLLIGVPRYTPRPSVQRSGLTALFLGGQGGLGNSPNWLNESTRPMAHQGAGVVFCDFNGDKLADLVVNAPFMVDPARRVGRIFFYPGSTNSLSGSPSSVLQGSLSNLYAVSEMTCAGDVNNDGYQDLLLTSARFTRDFKEEGMGALYFGSKTGLVLSASWQVFGGQPDANFGASAVGLGDVNGDGYDDVLIGAPGFGNNHSETGRAFLFFGSSTGLQTNAAWFLDGTVPSTRFGRSVASAGDVNGDGLRDFLISTPGAGAGGSLPGTVSLFLGSRGKISPSPAWQITGENPASAFGYTLALLGDVDGDHHPDLLIGAPNFSGQYPHEGAAFLFRGDGTFFAKSPDWVLYGGQLESRVGYVVRAAGDLNRDGFADFAVGSPFFHLPSYRGRGAQEMAGRLDIFYGAPIGYRKGQLFPSDGIGSKPRSRIPAVAPVVATSSTLSVPRVNRFPYSALGFSLTITAGAIFWTRRAQRLATEAERARIARDLHDDLGAQLSRLQQATSSNPAAAREAILALDRAIWSANPANDTLENLVSFIGQYAAEFFSGSGISLRFDAPLTLPDLKLDPELRKNSFLAVKEALNNILKHSSASAATIQVAFEHSVLTILVGDNGRGLPSDSPHNGGNGLANMAHRMRAVHSSFAISSRDKGGTEVSFRIKL